MHDLARTRSTALAEEVERAIRHVLDAWQVSADVRLSARRMGDASESTGVASRTTQLLTTAEAARYLRFATTERVRCAVHRGELHPVGAGWRGFGLPAGGHVDTCGHHSSVEDEDRSHEGSTGNTCPPMTTRPPDTEEAEGGIL